MKVLILGSGGMLGHLTTIYLKEKRHSVDNLSFPNCTFDDSFVCDVTDLNKFEEYLDLSHYDIIINCVALLIRASEDNKSRAVFLNSYFPHWLESKYKNTNTKIIQVSTDGVFGDGQPPFSETDPHLCTSFYARSKSLGELNNDKDLTIRSSFFGPDINNNGKGLLNWFFSQNGNIKGFKNVLFTGVTSLEFAKFVDEVGLTATGVYNLGASGTINKCNLLELFKSKLSIDNINIIPDEKSKSNTSVKTIRTDISYTPKDYEAMTCELCKFIKDHKDLYPHYKFIGQERKTWNTQC